MKSENTMQIDRNSENNEMKKETEKEKGKSARLGGRRKRKTKESGASRKETKKNINERHSIKFIMLSKRNFGVILHLNVSRA